MSKQSILRLCEDRVLERDQGPYPLPCFPIQGKGFGNKVAVSLPAGGVGGAAVPAPFERGAEPRILIPVSLNPAQQVVDSARGEKRFFYYDCD